MVACLRGVYKNVFKNEKSINNFGHELRNISVQEHHKFIVAAYNNNHRRYAKMNYEIFCEESSVIGIYDYMMIKNKIEKSNGYRVSCQGLVRGIYFNQDINYLTERVGGGSANTDRYSINIYDNDPQHMVLDKRSSRDGTIFRQHTYISPDQCERMIHKDIKWMADSENLLFRDLYLQMTINQKWPGVIVDYTRQAYRLAGGDFLVFDTSIQSSYDIKLEAMNIAGLAGKDFHMESRLEPGKVVMTYRQSLGMPKILAGLMDLSENYRLAGHAEV